MLPYRLASHFPRFQLHVYKYLLTLPFDVTVLRHYSELPLTICLLKIPLGIIFQVIVLKHMLRLPFEVTKKTPYNIYLSKLYLYATLYSYILNILLEAPFTLTF